MSDLSGTILTVGFVLLFLGLSETLAKLDYISKENARKIIHISVGNVVFFVPLFDTRWIAAFVPALFVLGNFMLSPMSPIKQLRLHTFEAGHAWGTILYPFSLSITTYLFFNNPWILVAVFFPLVYGDGMAAIVGPRAKRGIFSIYGNQKTLIGTASIAFFSWISVLIGIVILGYSISLAIIVASVIASLSPFIELLSPKGTDNLVIPIILSVIVFGNKELILTTTSSVNSNLYFIGLIFGLLFAIGGYLGGFLTNDGAITGFLITTLLLGLGGITLGVELFLFFILGSLTTKLVGKFASTTQEEFEKGSERRDAIQAMAKAGLPAILVLLFLPNYSIHIFYLITGILSAALVDTIATEVGIATKGTPVHILKPWKKAKSGETGVISLKGTLGGLSAGIIFAIITYLTHLIDVLPLDLQFLPHLLVTTIGGLLGMIADAIFGVTLQRHNKCQICDKILESGEHHGQKTDYHRGIRWFNNDVTNFIGTAVGGITAFGLSFILFG